MGLPRDKPSLMKPLHKRQLSSLPHSHIQSPASFLDAHVLPGPFTGMGSASTMAKSGVGSASSIELPRKAGPAWGRLINLN